MKLILLVCLLAVGAVAQTTLTNCALANPNDATRCLICKMGFGLRMSDWMCTDNTAIVAKCAIFDKTDKTLCLQCQAGWALDNDNKCTINMTTETLDSAKPELVYCTKWNDATPKVCQRYRRPYGKQSDGTVYVESGAGGVPACMTYTSSGQCSACHYGFKSSGATKCVYDDVVVADPNGCQSYDATGKCTTCQTGKYEFTFTTEKTCVDVPATISGCIKYDQSTGACTECTARSKYYKSSTTSCESYSTATNCWTFHKTLDECVDCPNGRYLNGSKACVMSTYVAGCETYSGTEDKCVKCTSKFLEAGKCTGTYAVTNCAVYNADADACDVCDAGYFKATGETTCTKYTKPGCVSPSGTTDACLACSDEFYLSTDHCVKRINSLNICATYTLTADTCATCGDGKYMDSTNSVCLAGGYTGCKTYTQVTLAAKVAAGDQTCAECTDLANQIPGASQKGACVNRTNSKEGTGNCATYDKITDTCATCGDGFYMDSTNTVCLAGGYTGCKSYTQVTAAAKVAAGSQTCEECTDSDNQIPPATKKGACIDRPNTKGAAGDCLGKNILLDKCTGCANMNYLDNTNETCVASTYIANCAVYSQVKNENKCVTCEDGYKIAADGSTCTAGAVANCTKYVTGGCDECATGYYKANVTTCTRYTKVDCVVLNAAEDKCTTCSCNKFWLKQGTDQCYGDLVGDQKTGCTKYVQGGATVACEVCDATNFLQTDSCTGTRTAAKKTNCDEHEIAEDGCKTCSAGNYLDGTKTCQTNTNADTNCATKSLTTAGECGACNAGYYLAGGICYSRLWSLNKCDQYDPAADSCTGCATATKYLFPLQGGKGCYGSGCTTGCDSCPPGYYNNTDAKKCIQITANCNLGSVKDTCTGCDAGYWKQNATTCTRINSDTNCIGGDTENVCTKCSGDKWAKVTQASPKIQACTAYSNPLLNCAVKEDLEDACKTCNKGHFLSNDKLTCTLVDANCKECATATTCEKCDDGYYNNSTSCDLIDANCKTVTVSTKCDMCQPGYRLSAAKVCTAMANPFGCEEAHDETTFKDKCTKCFDTYMKITIGTSPDDKVYCIQRTGTSGIQDCTTFPATWDYANNYKCEACKLDGTDQYVFSSDKGMCEAPTPNPNNPITPTSASILTPSIATIVLAIISLLAFAL